MKNPGNQVLVREVYSSAVQKLKQADIPEPELEVSILLARILNMDRTALLLSGDRDLSKEQWSVFEKSLARRMIREPLAYIIGEREFWSLPFKVTPDVLIPRPETELLLEKALAAVKSTGDSAERQFRILDLGTGSGVIAVIMALELPSATLTAVDRSLAALLIAKRNAENHRVAARMDFINCDWFGGLQAKKKFDMIICNPPYINADVLNGTSSHEAGLLQPEVMNYEPRLALDGGKSGLTQIKRLAVDLENFLEAGGWFFMEIGADQKNEVLDIFTITDLFDRLVVFHDLAGLPRVFQARRKFRHFSPEMKQ